MLSLATPVTVLDQVDQIRTAEQATGTVLYSLRAGRLIRVAEPAGDGRWMCRPLSAHDADCQVVVDDVDLSTALTPDQLTTGGHPNPRLDPAAFRAAWRSRVWQQYGSRAGQVADRVAAVANTPVRSPRGAPVVLIDRERLRRYALAANMHAAGFRRHLAVLLRARLLVPARLEGLPAVELTLPAPADIQAMALADTMDGVR